MTLTIHSSVNHFQKTPDYKFHGQPYFGESKKSKIADIVGSLSVLAFLASMAAGLSGGVGKIMYQATTSYALEDAVRSAEKLHEMNAEVSQTGFGSPDYEEMLNTQVGQMLDKVGEEVLERKDESMAFKAFRRNVILWLGENSRLHGEGRQGYYQTPDIIRFNHADLGREFYELSKDQTINSNGDIKIVFDKWVEKNLATMDEATKTQFIEYGHQAIEKMDWRIFIDNLWAWGLLGGIAGIILSLVGVAKCDRIMAAEVDKTTPKIAAPPPPTLKEKVETQRAALETFTTALKPGKTRAALRKTIRQHGRTCQELLVQSRMFELQKDTQNKTRVDNILNSGLILMDEALATQNTAAVLMSLEQLQTLLHPQPAMLAEKMPETTPETLIAIEGTTQAASETVPTPPAPPPSSSLAPQELQKLISGALSEQIGQLAAAGNLDEATRGALLKLQKRMGGAQAPVKSQKLLPLPKREPDGHRPETPDAPSFEEWQPSYLD